MNNMHNKRIHYAKVSVRNEPMLFFFGRPLGSCIYRSEHCALHVGFCKAQASLLSSVLVIAV